MNILLLLSVQQGILFQGLSLRLVQPGAFCGLKSLEELDLSKNKLTTPPELLPVKPTLQNLKMKDNKIHLFPANYFDGFNVLKQVDIRQNEIYSVPNVGYVGHSLQVLVINRNKLKTLDDRLTEGLIMTVLESLRVYENEIQHVNVAILAQMPKLNHLDLSRNQLHHFADPTAYLQSNRGRSMLLMLHLNPLTCDKALSWVLVLAEYEIENRLGNQVECHQPHCLKGRDVMSLSKCSIHRCVAVNIHKRMTDTNQQDHWGPCISHIVCMPYDNKLDSWWRHQMETFSALLAICTGVHRSPVNSPHKGQWRGALMFSLICVWINDWVNNREAGDLRRYRAHYDVIVMLARFYSTCSVGSRENSTEQLGETRFVNTCDQCDQTKWQSF